LQEKQLDFLPQLHLHKIISPVSIVKVKHGYVSRKNVIRLSVLDGMTEKRNNYKIHSLRQSANSFDQNVSHSLKNWLYNLLLRWSHTGTSYYLQEQRIRSSYQSAHRSPNNQAIWDDRCQHWNWELGAAMRLIRQKRSAELTIREQPWNRYWVCSCYPCLVVMIVIHRSCSRYNL